MKTFKTPKGTVLPIKDIKGKDYLEVKYRIVWFREENPKWAIETEMVHSSDTSCLFRAKILDENKTLVSMGHKREDKKDFHDFEEKSETGSIGRALGHLGYGTQFAPDLDEGDRIVDAPIESKEEHKPIPPTASGVHNYVIKVGKKYKDKKLSEVPIEELWQYANWLEAESEQKNKPLNSVAIEFIAALIAFTPPTFNAQEKLPF